MVRDAQKRSKRLRSRHRMPKFLQHPFVRARTLTEEETMSEQKRPQNEQPETGSSKSQAQSAQSPYTRVIVGLACVLIILACAASILLTFGTYWRTHHKEIIKTPMGPRDFIPPEQRPVRVPKPTGSPEAKLKIEVCFGPCLQPFMRAMSEIGKAWPDKVYVTCCRLNSLEGDDFQSRHHIAAGAVFINDKNKFTIKKGHVERHVELAGPLGQGFSVEDVQDAFLVAWEEVYGPPPEDVTKKISEILDPTKKYWLGSREKQVHAE